jgi:hypothetical protein
MTAHPPVTGHRDALRDARPVSRARAPLTGRWAERPAGAPTVCAPPVAAPGSGRLREADEGPTERTGGR